MIFHGVLSVDMLYALLFCPVGSSMGSSMDSSMVTAKDVGLVLKLPSSPGV